jgi:hypothetical protein
MILEHRTPLAEELVGARQARRRAQLLRAAGHLEGALEVEQLARALEHGSGLVDAHHPLAELPARGRF